MSRNARKLKICCQCKVESEPPLAHANSNTSSHGHMFYQLKRVLVSQNTRHVCTYLNAFSMVIPIIVMKFTIILQNCEDFVTFCVVCSTPAALKVLTLSMCHSFAIQKLFDFL